MYCPETIIFNTRYLIIMHHAKYDYIVWARVPFLEKLNILRYSLCFKPKGYHQENKPIIINKKGVSAVALNNFIFKHVRPKLCHYFGIHHHPDSVHGENYCFHCDLEKEDT